MKTIVMEAPCAQRPDEPLIAYREDWYTRSAVASNFCQHFKVGGVYLAGVNDPYLTAWRRLAMAPEPVESERELIRKGAAEHKRPRSLWRRAIGYVANTMEPNE